GWFCVLAVVPVILLYMAYYWAPERVASATMRFVLPTFVCFCAAAVWGLERLLSRASPAIRATALVVVFVTQVTWGVPTMLQETKQSAHSRRVLALIASQLEEQAEEGAVVMAQSQILQNIDFVRKWRLMDLTMLRSRGRMGRFAQRGKDSNSPTPMQMEKRAIQAEQYEGQYPFERERSIAWDISEWAGEHKVYYIGTAEELEQLPSSYFSEENMRILARFTLPEAPKRREPEGMMGAGARRPNRGAQDGPPGMEGPPDGAMGEGGDQFRQRPGAQQGMGGRQDRFGGPQGAQQQMGGRQDRFGGPQGAQQGMGGRQDRFGGPQGAQQQMGGRQDRFGGGGRNAGGRRGRGGGGGPMRMGALLAAKEIVIAEWTWMPGL
ncbi:MAG: hypothetical protein HON70_19450, partial [Lentisphaerae bacterium]|nr:hypothetical protein [Lentisphaerota bacterium]